MQKNDFSEKILPKIHNFLKELSMIRNFSLEFMRKKEGEIVKKKNKMVNVTSAPQIFFPPKFETFPSYLIHFSIKQLMRSLIKGHFKGKLTQGTSSGTFPGGGNSWSRFHENPSLPWREIL